MLLPLSFVIEGIPYHKEVSEKINVSKNLFKKSQLDTSFQTLFSQIDASKYQAIIPLPFYHTGSENFAKFGTDKMYTFSMVAAYHLSLPLTSNYTTRTSILESKNVLEILAPNYYYKDIESEIKSEKPFLVLYDNEYLNDYETDLLNKSVKIASSGDYSFYCISKSVLFESSNKKEIDEFKKLRPSLVEKKFCLIAPQDTSKYFDVKTFESTLTTVARTGKGSLTGFMKDYTTIATVEKGLLEVDQEYNVGLWIRNTGENYGQDMINAMLIVQSEDPSGAIEWVKIANPNESFINEGDWSYVEVKFWCKDSNNKYSVVLKGNDKLKHKFFIDDFIIRDQRLTLYRDVKTSQEGLLSVQKNNDYIVENK